MKNKYIMNPDENKHQFATRIVVTEDRPMNAKAIHDCVDERSVDMTMEEMQAHVCYAVKLQNLDKTRVVKNHETGGTHVVYHPLGQHPIGDEIPQPLFNKKKKMKIKHSNKMVAAIDSCRSEAIDIETAPLDEVVAEARQGLVITPRTPIIKPSGMASNILDVLSVYHGKTVEQIEDIIMSKIRTARVDNKTLKHASLFSVLKELVG
tara:strand:- start:5657 stop:6277 length:621 start_codon:yes stop_codon:yes gene_type:complete